jgi:hypothetical protein
VLDRANDFYAVATDDGKTGWIAAGDVKPIVGSAFKPAGYYKLLPQDDSPGIFYHYGKLPQDDSPGTFYPPPHDNSPQIYTATPTLPVQSAPQDSNVTARLFKSLTEQAVQFRDSYKDNKYIYVSGFTVHVGIPPSVDLAFTFR